MTAENVNPQEFYEELQDKAARLAEVREFVVDMAWSLIGRPAIRYVDPEAGLSTETGFDCSGFVCALLSSAKQAYQLELAIPRHANEQYRTFGEPVDYMQRIPGDLVYFAPHRKGDMRILSHVGVVVNDTEYIHSPGKDDSVITAARLPAEQLLFEDVNPGDIYARNPVGIKRISVPIGSGRWHAW